MAEGAATPYTSSLTGRLAMTAERKRTEAQGRALVEAEGRPPSSKAVYQRECTSMNEVRPVRNARFFLNDFSQRTLDALLAHIAVLKDDGTIVAVNAAWSRFARLNQLDYRQWGPGANYLRVCTQATGECAEEAPAMAAGIKEVISERTGRVLPGVSLSFSDQEAMVQRSGDPIRGNEQRVRGRCS